VSVVTQEQLDLLGKEVLMESKVHLEPTALLVIKV